MRVPIHHTCSIVMVASSHSMAGDIMVIFLSLVHTRSKGVKHFQNREQKL